MVSLIAAGEIRLGQHNKKRNTWAINRVQPKKTELKKLKTVWRHTSHNAGTHGSGLLAQLLGQGQAFSFPKSVYATRDCLAAVCRSRPDALIVDFFAGSGTTPHATLLMNEADGGRRRCVLVTKNEVEERTARQLRKEGVLPGDPEWEKHGVFEQATRPRCEAVVTGHRPDGTLVPGRHFGGRPFAEGFSENVEFYRLNYLDPDEVDLGLQFEAILPTLWMTAGTGAVSLAHSDEGLRELGRIVEEKDDEGLIASASRAFSVAMDLWEHGTLYHPERYDWPSVRDPGDGWMLDLAWEVGADYIVSWDPHLTEAEMPFPVEVLEPHQLLERLPS